MPRAVATGCLGEDRHVLLRLCAVLAVILQPCSTPLCSKTCCLCAGIPCLLCVGRLLCVWWLLATFEDGSATDTASCFPAPAGIKHEQFAAHPYAASLITHADALTGSQSNRGPRKGLCALPDSDLHTSTSSEVHTSKSSILHWQLHRHARHCSCSSAPSTDTPLSQGATTHTPGATLVARR